VAITLFRSLDGKSPEPVWTSLAEFSAVIASTTASVREALPTLSLARFGGRRSAKGSRRFDKNIREHFGCVVDIDGGLAIEEVAERFRAAHVPTVIHSTPSGRPDRCRVLLPFSVPQPPDRHATMVSRAASLLSGATVDSASWNASQCFYFGVLTGQPAPTVIQVDGSGFTPVDLRDDLPVAPRPPAQATTMRARGARANGEAKGNGADPDPIATADGNLRTEFRRRVVAGSEGTHGAMVSWAGQLAAEGCDAEEITEALIGALKERPFLARSPDWQRHLDDAPRIAEWTAGKEDISDWPQAPKPEPRAETADRVRDSDPWAPPLPPEVDLSVLRLNRRPAPRFPLDVLGDRWANWVTQAAYGASAPPDYVVASLLPVASILIGNARHAEGKPGWIEPPALWCAAVGDSGDSKSPGADAIARVVPVLEKRMRSDFPDRFREWEAAAAIADAKEHNWKVALAKAQAKGNPAPERPLDLDPGPEPQMPRLRMTDTTIEKLAELLCTAAPKGVWLSRDELSGFILAMSAYNLAGRSFYLESYGGRAYTVDRVKHPVPFHIPYFTCALSGSIQPGRLAALMAADADDGFMARLLMFWPEPVDLHMTEVAADIEFAVNAMDRLRLLELRPIDDELCPVIVPLARAAWPLMEAFDHQMAAEKRLSAGLMTSAYGKCRGHALRLALVLEMLWWCAADMNVLDPGPPSVISVAAFTAAARLVAEYAMPMAERVYGDAAVNAQDRAASLMARKICQDRFREVHVRTWQRKVRLPGLTDAEAIHEACQALVEAGWLLPPPPSTRRQRAWQTYIVNPKLWEALDAAV
jgi:hypothetical protein